MSPLRHAVLTDRALIAVEGEDWRGFLQGLLTQDVDTIAPGETRYGALLTPQGRLLYDVFIHARAPGAGDGALLDVAAEGADAFLQRLQMYRLRAKVRLERVPGAVGALFAPAGSQSASAERPQMGGGWRLDPRLGALGWRGADVDAPPGAAAAHTSAYNCKRLELGVGDLVRDGLADKAYALEANLDLLNGVDFRKGCFVGQETTSRMKRRSVVRSRLLPLRFEGPVPAPGTEVLAGSLRAGVVCSGADGVALALLRLDRAVGAALEADGRPVTLAVPAWAAEAVAEAAASSS